MYLTDSSNHLLDKCLIKTYISTVNNLENA